MRFALTICLALCWLPQGEEPKKPAPADEIAWAKPEGRAEFEQGHSAYEAKKYAEAHQHFKKSRSHADGKDAKAMVDLWIAAALGAHELEGLERKAQDSGAREGALRAAESDYPKYEKTPIGGRYREFIERLRKEVYFVLEDFERPSKRFSEAQGKTFVADAKRVHEGKHALKWQIISDPAELKIKELPKDLTAFKSVAFWMEFEGTDVSYQAMFRAGGESKTDTGKITENVFVRDLPGHKGAKRVEIPFKDFQTYGQVDWKNVEDFRVRFIGRRNVTVYIDEIVLIRK
ncbi:MAG: hypothetical protein L0Z55_05605 [Planctomycetes bacterium]|nr:hypothetical protein [Planctomycetota bacterium]